MISKLWITMPADLGGLAALGEAVRTALNEANASSETAETIELCIAEAVNHAIERSRDSPRANRVEVQVCIQDGRLEIEIGDRGEKLPPGPPTLSFDPEDRSSWPEGGMGLYLIHQLMADVQYKSDPTRNIIQMSCSLKAP
ncbi:MAG: ATP-binding protein [Kofleriaceae bacterium]